jgi:hypothetical protein
MLPRPADQQHATGGVLAGALLICRQRDWIDIACDGTGVLDLQAQVGVKTSDPVPGNNDSGLVSV